MWITGVEIIKRQTRAAYTVWLQVRVCERTLIGYRLYDHPVCDTKAALQLQLRLVVLY